ncbi:MAG: cation-translocating P-type ATPase [Paracoccaceae bacterium]
MATDGHDPSASDTRTSGCGACCGSLSAEISSSAPSASAGRSFRVSGLDCAEEVAILNRVVGPAVGGARYLAFDVMNGRMTLLDGADPLADAEIIKIVRSTGMSASVWDAQRAGDEQAAHLKRQKLFTAISGAFLLCGLAYHMVETGASGALTLFSSHGTTAIPLAEIGLFLGAVLFGVWLVAPKAWSSARHLAPDMNLLMMVAVIGAIGIGEYFEAATVAFLFALSLTLESWSVGRARNAVSALLDLAPPTARLIRLDGTETEVPAAEVAVGAHFIVRGGDRIALDGEVVSGTSGVDQSPITGESAYVPKEHGDAVYAGTINGDGTLTVRATKSVDQTVLSKIIRMVGDAHSRRAEVEQWVTRFARVYTPAVMGLALAVAVLPPLLNGANWSFWVYNALVLLVIACPCALVISTPVSIVAALASSARNGVLIKGGAYVEAPGHLKAIAMDKTGTLTMGQPEVSGVHPIGPVAPRDLLGAAAALEARSSHPLAGAILERAARDGIPIEPAGDTRSIPGRGVEGSLEGREIWLGSEQFAVGKGAHEALPADLLDAIKAAGSTVVIVGTGTAPLGLIELRDRIRPDAREMVARLHALGVEKIVMLTGDNDRTARAVATEVGVDTVHAELLPEDKVRAVAQLAGTHDVVAMIGDGVNDAPAMARAHFAVAMGAVGSDAAIETADIALMTDDIGKLPWLVSHSRRTMGIIRQNIAFALVTKAVFVVLTAFGLASMWGAIAADMGVSLLVVANALRLLGDGRGTAETSERPGQAEPRPSDVVKAGS